MKKFVRVMYCLCFCTLASLFVVCPSYSAHNYIVLDDVVFVRSDPRTSLPLEKMTIPQLQDEFLRTETFPPHFFYGQMVRGELEPGVPDAIRIYALFEGKAVTGYIDKKKLWQEPAVKAPEAPSGLILRDLDVFLLPDGSTRKVLSLYQGEVVQTIGMLHYQGGSWIKVQFNKRFGYIAEKNIRPLLAAHLDKSSLAEQEIPKAGRNLNRVLSDQERSGLAKTGFF